LLLPYYCQHAQLFFYDLALLSGSTLCGSTPRVSKRGIQQPPTTPPDFSTNLVTKNTTANTPARIKTSRILSATENEVIKTNPSRNIPASPCPSSAVLLHCLDSPQFLHPASRLRKTTDCPKFRGIFCALS